jgi:hypothetical protein
MLCKEKSGSPVLEQCEGDLRPTLPLMIDCPQRNQLCSYVRDETRGMPWISSYPNQSEARGHLEKRWMTQKRNSRRVKFKSHFCTLNVGNILWKNPIQLFMEFSVKVICKIKAFYHHCSVVSLKNENIQCFPRNYFRPNNVRNSRAVIEWGKQRYCFYSLPSGAVSDSWAAVLYLGWCRPIGVKARVRPFGLLCVHMGSSLGGNNGVNAHS